MPERKRIDAQVEARVLSRSARRCCLCYHLQRDFSEKLGQIAHLDQNPANGSEDNLAFLCMEHHSLYDSTTRQHKNFTIAEAKAARDKLYGEVDGRKLCEWVLVLDGTFPDFEKARVEAIVEHLRKILGDPHLTIKRVDPGSVRLLVEASEAAYEKMRLLVRNGTISRVLDYPILEIDRTAIEGPERRTFPPSGPSAHPTTAVRHPPLQFPKPPFPPLVYGSAEWLDDFVTRQRPLLVDYFAAKGLSHSAEDLTEEVFVRFLSRHYRDKPPLEPSRTFRLDALLQGLARNMVINAYRQTRREFPIEQFPEEIFATEQPKLDLELSTELQEAMSSLSPRDRAIVTLRLLDWPLEEIAGALAISQSAANVSYSRALKKLRASLERLKRRE